MQCPMLPLTMTTDYQELHAILIPPINSSSTIPSADKNERTQMHHAIISRQLRRPIRCITADYNHDNKSLLKFSL